MFTKLLISLTLGMWWMQACVPAVEVAAPADAASSVAPSPSPAPADTDTAATQPTTNPPVPVAPPAEPEVVIPADVSPAVPQPQLPVEVNNLLDQLEQSAADLQAFTADIQYEKEDVILGRRELRTGDLIYHQDRQSNEKSFAILFDTAIIAGRRQKDPKHYVFNGRWLAEIDPANKQFIKREIVPPGRQLDPLKLGEGPFPLPIGQPKAEVLARFDVTVAEMPRDGLLKDLQNVQGISLVPKAGTREAREYSKVDLFYDRTTLLPVGIITVDIGSERKVVRFNNVQRNPALKPEQLARLDIAEPNPREWRIDVRPWVERD